MAAENSQAKATPILQENRGHELLHLLDLPAIQATLCRAIALTRPVGPSRHWAMAAIVEEVNAALRELQIRRRMRISLQERRQQRKRNRSGQPHDGSVQHPQGKAGRNVTGSEDDGSDVEEAETGRKMDNGDGDAASASEGQSRDDDSETEDEDDDEDEDHREQEQVSRLAHDSGSLEVAPQTIWTKLSEYYNLEGLNSLEDAALKSEELAPRQKLRSEGFYTLSHIHPERIKRMIASSKIQETSDRRAKAQDAGGPGCDDSDAVEGGQRQEQTDGNGESSSESSEDGRWTAVEFALVPGLDYKDLVEQRAVDTSIKNEDLSDGDNDGKAEGHGDPSSSPLSESTSPIKPKLARKRKGASSIRPKKRVKRERQDSTEIDASGPASTSSDLSEGRDEEEEDEEVDEKETARQQDSGVGEEDDGDAESNEGSDAQSTQAKVGAEDSLEEGAALYEGDDDEEEEEEGDSDDDNDEAEEDRSAVDGEEPGKGEDDEADDAESTATALSRSSRRASAAASGSTRTSKRAAAAAAVSSSNSVGSKNKATRGGASSTPAKGTKGRSGTSSSKQMPFSGKGAATTPRRTTRKR